RRSARGRATLRPGGGSTRGILPPGSMRSRVCGLEPLYASVESMVSAYQIGPLVLSAPRLYAALGRAVLVLAAEVVAWRRNRAAMPSGRDAEPPSPASASWAWNAAVAVVLGARMGFVLENLGAFLAQPLAMIQIWQGGFSPWWGVGAGVLVSLRSVLLSKTPASVVVL